MTRTEFDPIRMIRETTDLQYLLDLRDKWIPMDYDALDKYLEKKRKGIKKMEDIVNKRIKELS